MGSLIIRPVFHDNGGSSDSQMSRRMSVSNIAGFCSSPFSMSKYIWSIPRVFPSFNAFIALLTFSTISGSVSMSSNSDDGMMIASVSGSSHFSACSKCSFQHLSLSSSFGIMFPSRSFTGMYFDWKPVFVSELPSPLALLFFRCISSCPPWYSF